MLGKILEKIIIERIKNYDKIKTSKDLRKQKKKKHKNMMVKLFGKIRYYLSFWFGEWVLYTCNNKNYKEYDPKPYQKFYTDAQVANRYANKLKEKYEYVKITMVFNEKQKCIGYLLNGAVKKVTDTTQQPSNIIYFNKYKRTKVN